MDFNDYMQSICGDEQLIHVLSSGKCGTVHASSFDDRFVIKTLRKDEIKVLNLFLNMILFLNWDPLNLKDLISQISVIELI